MGQPVDFSLSNFPEDYCATSPAEFAADLVARLSGELRGENDYNRGPDTPAPDDQDKPWFKTDANGLPERWYVYINGAWIARHPDIPGKVIMYEGTEASITTLDGGEAGAVTATTGPMWEKVSSLNGKFPVGPGTLASGATILVGGTGGAEEHTIARDELPNIQLGTESVVRTNVDEPGDAHVYVPDDTEGSFVLNNPLMTESINGDVEQEPVNIMPPYVGIWFIRRTQRTHYRV